MLTVEQMIARRVEDATSLFLVESAIQNRIPFSFVRMNDGEAYIIGAKRGVSDEEVAWILHHWWGWTEVDFAFVEWLRSQLLEVAASTDLLGFFDRCDKKPGRFMRMGILLREHANLEAVKAFVSPEAALQWHDAHQLERVLRGQPSVKLICSYDISASFAAKFGVGSVEWIPIPGHARYSDAMRWSYSHPHRRFAEVDAYLKTIAKDAIVLVGAGVLGKIYCKTVKEHGGIALDLGSVFDSWAENMRRPSARVRRRGM